MCATVVMRGERRIPARRVQLASPDVFVGRGFAEQNLKNEQAGAYDYRTVGNVKGRPLVLTDVEEQEIDNMAADQAVPEIADGAAQNQGKADAGGSHGMAIFPEQSGDDHKSDQREENQAGNLPFRRRVGEKAESGTAVFDMGQTEKSGDQADAVVKGQVSFDGQLRETVEHHHEEGDQKVVTAHCV